MGQLVLNPEAVKRAAVGRALPDVEAVLRETYSLSQRRVPVRTPRTGDPRPTGRLKRSGRIRGPRVLVNTVSGSVRYNRPYALAVHDGAERHAIVARRKPLLVYYWEREATWFYGRRVNHPGVRRFARTEYLYLPLVLVGRRHNFVVRRLAPIIGGGVSEV